MDLRIFAMLLFAIHGAEICKTDNDCLDLNSCVDELCVHKDIFPMAGIEYGGSIAMILIAIMSNAAGVGGSTICISLMLLLFKFDAHACVALTQVFVFSGTSAATLLKFKERHPTRDRPLIYFDVLMQIISPLLLGVTIGVLLNPSFPAWLILALLTILVVFLFSAVFKKGITIYKREKTPDKVVVPSQDILNEIKNSEVLVEKIEVAEKEKTHAKGNSDQINTVTVEGELSKISINSANQAENNTNTKTENLDPVLLRKITTIYENEKKIIGVGQLIFFIILAAIAPIRFYNIIIAEVISQ